MSCTEYRSTTEYGVRWSSFKGASHVFPPVARIKLTTVYGVLHFTPPLLATAHETRVNDPPLS